MNFYHSYDDRDDDRLDNNDDWKNYKPCDDCGETFLKSDLIYVTTNNDDPSRKFMQWSEQHLTNNKADHATVRACRLTMACLGLQVRLILKSIDKLQLCKGGMV